MYTLKVSAGSTLPDQQVSDPVRRPGQWSSTKYVHVCLHIVAWCCVIETLITFTQGTES